MLPLMQSTKLFLGKSFSIVLHWHTNRYYNRWWCMEMVHLKRGCGNFPTYSEMNYWRRCICMRCWWYIWIEKRRDPDEILFAIFDLVRKIEEEWEFVWIWIELKKLFLSFLINESWPIVQSMSWCKDFLWWHAYLNLFSKFLTWKCQFADVVNFSSLGVDLKELQSIPIYKLSSPNYNMVYKPIYTLCIHCHCLRRYGQPFESYPSHTS